MPKQKKRRKDQCLFCNRRKCCHAIYTPDRTFDEVACQWHGNELALYADEVLGSPGKMRVNASTSGTFKRLVSNE